MSETSNKYSRSDRSRFYDGSERTSYFTLGSRRNLMRGLSRLSTNRTSLSSPVSIENEQQCQDILCKRGFFKRIFYNNFNNLFNKNLMYCNNNCKKYGTILLILFSVNLLILISVFLINDPVTCKKELTSYRVGIEHSIMIDSEDCNLNRNEKLINFDEIYVYYKLFNYPFHFSSVYKLFSKVQVSGKISRNHSDLQYCNTYTKVLINGVNRILNPCGSHLVNVYNDQFKFFSVNDKEPNKAVKENEIEMDESSQALTNNQEYQFIKNISKEDKLNFNDYYWLDDTLEYSNDYKVGLNKNHDLINGWNKGNKISEQLNTEKSGSGVRNGHFIQWLTPPPFPTFTKLYGILKGPLELPLKLQFDNNYDVTLYGGKKFIILKASRFNMGHLMTFRIMFSIFTVLSLIFALTLLLYKPKNMYNIFNLL
ncbi:LEM3 (ligand-effect modulator 3) family / CDC50 family protein [Theileria parva strain Muguga]|uniref:LEM3 (ligand-effect modulator 3) family / CDC50 family protein n=1 Tax=Theileria parva strain Muguga TaxID=333668 RepID=UPI001C6181EE|nr:LEM3 (ligand-effect modulator 3) family / CDC50 family protein [Theileria parva strain Muguga]EAN33887.2 LEM3 (ligand-effect modulator 3) family / CDC50 family protein [Theileria parva strain Muguga]